MVEASAEMSAGELILRQSSSSSFSSQGDEISLPPFQQVGVPIHENAGPQSPLSSSTTTRSTQSPRKVNTQTRVVVRIRPLTASEQNLGGKACIRPILTKAIPHLPPAILSKKRVLSPRNGETSSPSPGGTRRSSPLKKMSPSKTRSSPRTSKCNKTFDVETEKTCKEIISTSLISGTENKMRFDFDQVIGPAMSQEQCYERTVGDVVRRNVLQGHDTTIVAVGHRKSGKSYTMSGGWKVQRIARENNSNVECSLTESAGILPRAIRDLFLACENQSQVSIFMSFYMIACEGGRTRDLLYRFRKKQREFVNGLSHVRVESSHEVKRLMDRASIKRASDIKEGRKFHLFCSFRVILANGGRFKGDDVSNMSTGVTSRLTFIKLSSTSNIDSVCPSKADERGYNLRDLLHSMTTDSGATDSTSRFTNLHRRLDEAFLGVTSTIIIGCVSPIQSELEHSMDFLRLVAMATKATFFKETSDESTGQSSFSELEEPSGSDSFQTDSSSTISTESALVGLKKTLQLADQAAKNAKESSHSLDAAATRWRAHRRKLTRASTFAALAQMMKLTNAKSGTKLIGGSVAASAQSHWKHPRQELRSTMPRASGEPKLLQENEKMKSQIGTLMKESKQHKQRITILEQNLADVNKQLAEEKQITSKLEDIRSILKRKAILQEERIQLLEQRVDTALKSNEALQIDLEKARFTLNGHQEMKQPVTTMQDTPEGIHGTVLQDVNNGSFEMTGAGIPASGVPLEVEGAEDNLLSVLNDSGTDATIYLTGDEEGSLASSEGVKNSVGTLGRKPIEESIRQPTQSNMCILSHQESSEGPSTNVRLYEEPKSSIIALRKLASCPCQNELVLSSGHDNKIEFYLPSLSVSCLCGKQQSLLSRCANLTKISSILRRWQTEFLASTGIVEIQDFIEAYKKDPQELAKCMVKWRTRKGMETMTEKSCSLALMIWHRTCTMVVQGKADSRPV